MPLRLLLPREAYIKAMVVSLDTANATLLSPLCYSSYKPIAKLVYLLVFMHHTDLQVY